MLIRMKISLKLNNNAMKKQLEEFIKEIIEKKKLTFSQNKCAQIHIGDGHNNCPRLYVHNEYMNVSEQEKYLGDMIHMSGKHDANIKSRVSKGMGIVSEILALLSEIPLGAHRV